MHRADLLRLLAPDDPDRVQLGRCCIGVRQGDEDVELRFVDGATETADVVIGADGIHSIVQSAVTTPVPHTFSGLAAYRSMVPADRVPEIVAGNTAYRADGSTLWQATNGVDINGHPIPLPDGWVRAVRIA